MIPKIAIGIGVVITLMSSVAPTSNAEESQVRAYKIGTCDWSLKMQSSIESFEFAKRNGLQGIQYSFGAKDDGLDLRLRKNRDTIRKTVKETGVEIASLGIGLLNKIPLATTDEAEQLVVDCIETMAKLKAEAVELEDRKLAAKVSPKIVLLAFFNKADINGKPDLIAKVIEKLKRIAPLAEEHGFVLGLETLLSESDLRDLMDRVGSPAVKVYYDTANSARMGYDIYGEIESLGAEHICEVHLKQDRDLLGNGNIDFKKVKSQLQKVQFKGWLIIEGSKPRGMSPTEATEQNAAYAQSLFGS